MLQDNYDILYLEGAFTNLYRELIKHPACICRGPVAIRHRTVSEYRHIYGLQIHIYINGYRHRYMCTVPHLDTDTCTHIDTDTCTY